MKPTTAWQEAELIDDNIACASQVDWSSESHREDAVRNIKVGISKFASDLFFSNRSQAIAAGLTEHEAACWAMSGELASMLLRLPELHADDSDELCTAIHVIQDKLLGRPAMQKMLEIRKAARSKS